MTDDALLAPNGVDTGRGRESNGLVAPIPAINRLLADVFTLYVKTKNYHWHMSGPHFRDYHLLLDEQASQLFEMTDVLAERVRKLGGRTLTSIGSIAKLQRLADDDRSDCVPGQMLQALAADNRQLVEFLQEAHRLCEDEGDVATTSLLETYIDEAQRRIWFLAEAGGTDR
ncbi:DNA starvation/stationary phase protection protein [Sphingomonas sp. BN140010]|uniref:DNA starvation/stationary phase protection protein n=1 Tax=Sphingomonas arvum TaxID=2992113 RepID=A0ABT3JDR6_9SPHN|nr:DNA starvation/stationary phase protection protein [Sphingomonas sp. BN140010]MCW3797211.1 DNA starvation/stationary phase protection protein [Sphingomonas sp. BN140010]